MGVKVFRSAVIDAPAAAVWHLVRDFNGHDKWHPAVAASQMENDELSDLVGAVRAFRLKDGGFLREQLLALSDRDMTFSYCILDAPIPLHDYVAHLRLRPITDGDRCFITWESSFDPPVAEARSLTELVATAIYEAGITALQNHFGGSRQPTRAFIEMPLPIAAPVPEIIPAPRSDASIRSQAIIVRAYGGPEELLAGEVEVPPPGPGEVRLHHLAIGVNFLDIHCRAGDFPMLSLPGVPGAEGVGTVIDCGSNVTQFRPGDRIVYAGVPLGAYAGVRLIPADIAVRLPDDIDPSMAAASFLKGMMADALLQDVYQPGPGARLFIRAAAGGVGSILVQMAAAAGAHVVGAVSTPDKVEAAIAAGCRDVVVPGGSLTVADLAGSMSAVFDGVGHDTYDESLALLAPRGHLIVYGQSSGPLGVRNLDQLADRAITLSRPNLAHYMRDAAEIGQRAQRLFDHLRRGVIRPRFTAFPLLAAAEAHRQLSNRATIGSIILTV
ncbi:SRPBCC family protein [Dongia sp.]|uniref:SRPBCC family protein n=1 Tax=Dongia sp. TaxID=1977262 RepID=UPI0035B49CAE